MYSITLKINDKSYPIIIDDLIELVSEYGDVRVELSALKPNSKNPIVQDERREKMRQARDLLYTQLEKQLYTLFTKVLVAFDMNKYPFYCESCKQGFNDADSLIAHTTDFDNPIKDDCKLALGAKLANV